MLDPISRPIEGGLAYSTWLYRSLLVVSVLFRLKELLLHALSHAWVPVVKEQQSWSNTVGNSLELLRRVIPSECARCCEFGVYRGDRGMTAPFTESGRSFEEI